MPNRRFVLKLSSLALLPFAKALACAGMGPNFPKQTIMRRKPPSAHEPLDAFVTRYLGHTDWEMDDGHRVEVELPEPFSGRIHRVRVNVRSLDDREEEAWSAIELILERTLTMPRGRNDHGPDSYTIRSKVGHVRFPQPGRVPSVAFDVNFGAVGRIICISDLARAGQTRASRKLVTVSRDLRIYCVDTRSLAPSYESAIAACEGLRDRSVWRWSDHISESDIDSYVSWCEEAIRVEDAL